MNVVLQAPLLGEQVSGVEKSPLGLLVKAIFVSVGAKPETVACTVIPVWPPVGASVRVGPVVTVNVAEAKSEVEPVTLIECAPSAALATTVNDPLIEPPLVNVQVGAITMSGEGVLLRQLYVPTSPDANPFPLIDTTVPTTPANGLSVIVGALVVVVTTAPFVKPVEATSVASVTPVTVIVYEPSAGDDPTVNEPLTVPVVLTVQDKAVTRVPPTPSATLLHPVGPALKPEPEIATAAPAGPKVGFRRMRGATWKAPLAVDA